MEISYSHTLVICTIPYYLQLDHLTDFFNETIKLYSPNPVLMMMIEDFS